jgi:hypothetical protein
VARACGTWAMNRNHFLEDSPWDLRLGSSACFRLKISSNEAANLAECYGMIFAQISIFNINLRWRASTVPKRPDRSWSKTARSLSEAKSEGD